MNRVDVAGDVVRLEKLRQRMAKGMRDGAPYLNRLDGHMGMPDESEMPELEARVAADERAFNDLKARLRELLWTLRKSGSKAVEEWVGLHTSALEEILRGRSVRRRYAVLQWVRRRLGRRLRENGDLDQSVRLRVARETLTEWEKLLRGEVDWVYLNDYWLPDYDKRHSLQVV